jgi:SNF2 family DNA or RNA helicase
MLAKQPLRFLLADDPGAGKTIMTGLLIKELMIRGDLHRCLIITPGNLVEQWQDELSRRFHIIFEILTNDRIEASSSANIFIAMRLPLYLPSFAIVWHAVIREPLFSIAMSVWFLKSSR